MTVMYLLSVYQLITTTCNSTTISTNTMTLLWKYNTFQSPYVISWTHFLNHRRVLCLYSKTCPFNFQIHTCHSVHYSQIHNQYGKQLFLRNLFHLNMIKARRLCTCPHWGRGKWAIGQWESSFVKVTEFMEWNE